MPIDRATSTERPPTVRSAVTNLSAMFIDGDGRGPYARRFRDVLFGTIGDLGGPDTLSTGEHVLARQAAGLDTWTQENLARIGKGEPIDITAHVTAINALIRIYTTLGLRRRAKTVPDLSAYLEDKAS